MKNFNTCVDAVLTDCMVVILFYKVNDSMLIEFASLLLRMLSVQCLMGVTG